MSRARVTQDCVPRVPSGAYHGAETWLCASWVHAIVRRT